jgi:NAD(P)-dependent dehydrogenase (short-subunit alcohol dehydrogenase family)
MSELRFEDRVAVITGGARGLGRAYALLLASRGAKVVVNDTGGDTQGLGEDAGAAAEVVEAVGSAGGQAVACIESVATAKGGEAIIQSALDHFGRIDILIHSAGNVRFAPLAEMSSEDFEAVLDVHLRGAFHVVRPAFSAMCEARYGRIVLTSSIAGIYGDRKVANYAAAKAGAIGLANVAALEGAEFGVRCNVILPGAVTRMAGTLDTQHLPPRMGPDMVAPAVAWLAHESCPLTGEMLVSLGGRVARAFMAETVGVHSDSWTIEDIARSISEIRDMTKTKVFSPVPSGHDDHIAFAFEMASGETP